MEGENREVASNTIYRLMHPRLTILVTSTDDNGKPNIITLAWSMPISLDPPMVAISIAPGRHSHGLISRSKEFVVNVPTVEIARETLYCGRHSGRDVDKFKETGLTASPAKKVGCPIIKECIAHLECRVEKEIVIGDHTLFVGEVVAAYAEEGAFDGKYDIDAVRPLYHLGGDDFLVLLPETFSPK